MLVLIIIAFSAASSAVGYYWGYKEGMDETCHVMVPQIEEMHATIDTMHEFIDRVKS